MRGLDGKTFINDFKAYSPQVMEIAKQIQANLSPEHPSFIQVMLRSHVEGASFMCLPSEFCKNYIQKIEQSVVLEVESGQSYNVKLLGASRAFSTGWKELARAEKLLEKDILVFHLVEDNKFKVYIVRGSELCLVEGAREVVKIDDCATTKGVDKKRKCVSCEKRPSFAPEEILGESIEGSSSLLKESENKEEGNTTKMRESANKSSNYLNTSSAETIEKVKELQRSLGTEHPSFIKLVMRSFMSPPFNLPSSFCKNHLPRSDATVVLEAENGSSYNVKFLSMKGLLSGGWTRFSKGEKLEVNDILIFQLVEPLKFKVYVIKASRESSLDLTPIADKCDESATATKK